MGVPVSLLRVHRNRTIETEPSKPNRRNRTAETEPPTSSFTRKAIGKTPRGGEEAGLWLDNDPRGSTGVFRLIHVPNAAEAPTEGEATKAAQIKQKRGFHD
jgi:hypothetical protein